MSQMQRIIDAVAPGHDSFTVHALEGSYSNDTQRIDIVFEDQPAKSVIVRRYSKRHSDYVNKPAREFNTLAYLRRHGVPVPEPLLLDEDGSVMGTPGIVTGFVLGEMILSASPQWGSRTAAFAKVLAQIHNTPYDDVLKPKLMDGNKETVWFLGGDDVPDYILDHPDGAIIWQEVFDRLPNKRETDPVLLHLDYWAGNVLWQGESVAAVVDWEEAAYGDPGVDVGYARMCLTFDVGADAADEFLRVYEAEMGKKVENLGLWELAAAARPLYGKWFADNPAGDRKFRQFVTAARRRSRL